MHKIFYIDSDEATQIIISVVAIAFAFSLAYASPSVLLKLPKEFIIFTVISIVTIGTGFILHEMAHKLVAIHYGAYARFQMWVQGLVLMVGLSVMGFLFAAPGAVYIYSNNITRKENGIISIAGPVTNIIIALAFFALAIFAPVRVSFSFMGQPLNIWFFGAQLNLILAIFNMLPMFPLDGSKVFLWNKLAWIGFMVACFAVGLLLLPISSLIMYSVLIVISFLLSGVFKR